MSRTDSWRPSSRADQSIDRRLRLQTKNNVRSRPRRYDLGRGKPVALQLTPRRFTATEYYQMIDAGVFGDDERLELIDGEIVEMSPIGNPHSACVRRLIRLLSE